MALTRDEFRKRLATPAGRAELGLNLTGDQAAEILANDALLDSWYRKVSGAGVPPAPRPTQPARTSEPAVAPKHTPTLLDRWKATSRKQRWLAAAIAGGLVILIAGTVVTANVVAAVNAAQLAAGEQAAEDAAAAGKSARELERAHYMAGRFLTEDRDNVEGPAPAWADPEAFADQQSAYAALERANRGDDTDAINDAIDEYKEAREALARQEAEAAPEVRQPEPSVPDAAPGCEEAMIAAAAIPADQVANTELEATATACLTVDAWIEAVQKYPQAWGMNRLTDADMPLYIQSLCYNLERTPMCVDARAKGYLD